MHDPTGKTIGWALKGIASNRCPRCGGSAVFRNLVFMTPKCPACGYVYERENGYFLGAMVIGYFTAAFSVVPTIGIGILGAKAGIGEVIGIAALQILVLTPVIFRYSRLAWIYLDFRADPNSRGPSKDTTH